MILFCMLWVFKNAKYANNNEMIKYYYFLTYYYLKY